MIYQISNFTVVLSSNEMVCAKKAAKRRKLVSFFFTHPPSSIMINKELNPTTNSAFSIFVEMVLDKTHDQTKTYLLIPSIKMAFCSRTNLDFPTADSPFLYVEKRTLVIFLSLFICCLLYLKGQV